MPPNLWERVRDWVLLAALLTLALATMLTQNEPLVRSLRAGALEVTGRLERSLAFAGRYLRALEENTELRRENIELSSEVARSREARLRNDELRRLLNLRDSTALPLRAARVVTKDITRQRNLMTLDVGRTDGVRPGMAVLNDRGIVGKVVLASEHFARVMPYLNTDFRVPARVQPLDAEGIVRWEGERLDRLLMEHVVKTEPVEPGMAVVTSGHSGTFPPGRRVGTVDSVRVQPGRNALLVYLDPAVPISSVQYVFVVLQTPSDERLALEAESLR
jgi:rod shape-determining protein MreC